MESTLTVLGAGSSAGTPVIGCTCSVCLSDHPRNRRSRSSCFIVYQGVHILVDTGPDLRMQALREKMTRVDAILYTHSHADHLHGLDDLRAFCAQQQRVLPVYASEASLAQIQQRFGYACFPPAGNWERPVLALHPIAELFSVAGLAIQPVPLLHGRSSVFGYRIAKVAWLTDVSCVPDASYSLLEGLDTVFIDCLRSAPHPTHFNVDQALEAAQRIAARQTYFIHLSHELDYESVEAQLPEGIALAYDGLSVTLN